MGSAILVGSAHTLGVPAEPVRGGTSLDIAKEHSGMRSTPDATLPTPAGPLRIVNPELVAAHFGQRIRFELTVEHPVSVGSVQVGVPARWRTRTVSGLLPSRGPRTTIELDGAAAGSKATFEIRDTGIPAGTYHLPVTWSDSAGSRSLGSLEVRLYAPVREERVPLNVTNDFGFNESETFVTVAPQNPANRVLVGSNGGGGYNAWISTNGGGSFTKRAVPTTMDAPDSTDDEVADLCCDPFSMADVNGNIWYGGLTIEDTAVSRIFVARVPPGSDNFVAKSIGLPERSGFDAVQDKPMGTIDNDPLSPKFGRLYVVWGEPEGAGTNIVMSQCDTRPGGVLNAANCDNSDNWTDPVAVTKGASGSYIYAEVAAAGDGKVYVIWWDYSATNAIRGATCLPAEDCADQNDWSAATTIATLDTTGGAPVPFACPILAQPGGRAAPATAMDVDRTALPSRGTVYVTWSDLRPGSGSTRCDDSTEPESTHLNFDSFVATGSNALPGPPSPSAVVGARLIGDANGAATSDEWFASVAVDQSTGQAYANTYSTRHDPSRFSTHMYAHMVNRFEALLPPVKVSRTQSDYSNEPCCEFGNDYGDYTGIDAAQGSAFVVWSENTINEDGEAFFEKLADTAFFAPPLVDFGDWLAAEAPTADGDGVFEPAETIEVTVGLVNNGAGPATSTRGILSTPDPNASVPESTKQYDTLQPDSSETAQTYRVQLGASVPCGQVVALRLDATFADVNSNPGGVAETVGLPTGCNASPPPVTPPTAPPPPPPAEPAPPPPPVRIVCVVPRLVGLRLAAARTRITRTRYCRLGRITRRKVTRRIRIGRVLAQTPRAGLRRPRGTRINLVVGRR